MAFHPYLFFSGNCAEAFTRYQEIFGGELELLRTSELPEGEAPPGAPADMVMHAALTFGDNLLMASDDPTGDGGPMRGVAVNYTTADPDEVPRLIDALADGGEVTMKPESTFWSPMFGMCVDRFGVPWMVNAEPPDEG
jgi:PhnB protein